MSQPERDGHGGWLDDALHRLGRDLLEEEVPENLVRILHERADPDRAAESRSAASKGDTPDENS